MNGQINDWIKLKKETMWYRHKDRHIDRLESPEIHLCIYGQVIFDKDAKTIQ